MQILVVDDEPAVRDSLERALRLEGYEIGLAADGARGARRRSTGDGPDAVVLDVMMPQRRRARGLPPDARRAATARPS